MPSKSPAFVCETPRLILRRFDENDIEALLGFRGDSEVMRFSLRGVESRDYILLTFLPKCDERYATDGFGQWAVVRKSDSACIGECGICSREIDGRKEFEIGYRMRRDCWGQGLATEAAQACRDLAFNTFGLTRVISVIEPANQASIRVAEKVGMTVEKETLFQTIPVRIYSLTRATAGAN